MADRVGEPRSLQGHPGATGSAAMSARARAVNNTRQRQFREQGFAFCRDRSDVGRADAIGRDDRGVVVTLRSSCEDRT